MEKTCQECKYFDQFYVRDTSGYSRVGPGYCREPLEHPRRHIRETLYHQAACEWFAEREPPGVQVIQILIHSQELDFIGNCELFLKPMKRPAKNPPLG